MPHSVHDHSHHFSLSSLSSGQLNRPSISVTSSDELLTGISDELTTETDGTLVRQLNVHQ